MSSKPNVDEASARTGEKKSSVRKAMSTPRARKKLPCGVTTCMHCHARCGADTTSYGSDNPGDNKE